MSPPPCRGWSRRARPSAPVVPSIRQSVREVKQGQSSVYEGRIYRYCLSSRKSMTFRRGCTHTHTHAGVHVRCDLCRSCSPLPPAPRPHKRWCQHPVIAPCWDPAAVEAPRWQRCCGLFSTPCIHLCFSLLLQFRGEAGGSIGWRLEARGARSQRVMGCPRAPGHSGSPSVSQS